MLKKANHQNPIAEVLGKFTPRFKVKNKLDERIEWIDAAKGIAISLVVIGHTLRGLESANLLKFEGAFGLIDKMIYSFHMPLMFLLSGLFIHKALHQRWFGYIWKHTQRLIWPLVLWTYIFFLCKIVAGGAANDPVGWHNFPFIPLPPRDHFWFLWALFVGFLIIKGLDVLGNTLKSQALTWPLAALGSLILLLLWKSSGL